jgi:mono/diheme cytochrome c family protein
MKKTAILLCTALAVAAAGLAIAQAQNAPAKEVPANVLDVFKRNCAHCHAGVMAPRGLRLVPGKAAAAIDAPSKEMPALKIINSADPGSSYLLMKIEGASGIQGKKMPVGKTLSDADFQALKAWILGLKKS